MTTDRERETEATYARVRASFGPNAARYTSSPGHSDASALAALVERVAPRADAHVLDIGTGAGHTALAFAPGVAHVVAFDLTLPMLVEVRRNATARGLANLALSQGAAEALPFRGAGFDVVTCRLTTHHFAALAQAVREMARVLGPGGQLVIMDTMVPEDDELDREINEIEWLRDPSHVRNCRPSEWRALVTAAGLTVRDVDLGYYDEGEGMSFAAWTARIGTSAENVALLRDRFHHASPRLTEALRIVLRDDDILFALPRLTLIAAKDVPARP